MALLKHIKNIFKAAEEKEWFETYWAFDFHSTIFKPTYDTNARSIEYYPFAKECLQLLSGRDDIFLITWTSSHPDEIARYNKIFQSDGIYFDHINTNPGISSKLGNFGHYESKFYFNILFEDKAGFDPETEWEEIYNYLKDTDYRPNNDWDTKY